MDLMSLLATTADYNYSYASTDISPAASAAVMMVFMLVCLTIGLVAYAVVAYFLSRIFKKAGIDSWKAWVPVYNTWTTFELGGRAGWWSVIALVPIVNLIPMILLYIAMYDIGLKFGKSGVFVLWAIFLPLVWYIWLALDQSSWNPLKGAPTRPTTAAADTSNSSLTPPTATL